MRIGMAFLSDPARLLRPEVRDGGSDWAWMWVRGCVQQFGMHDQDGKDPSTTHLARLVSVCI